MFLRFQMFMILLMMVVIYKHKNYFEFIKNLIICNPF
jgi:hypothetical protein